MTSHMEEVAKILGVEFGENFEIVNSFNGEWIANACIGRYCLYYSDYNASYKESSGCTLERLLTGAYTINQKLQEPWEPRLGEIYWHVSMSGTINYYVWGGSRLDVYNYKLGNCYQTEREAKDNRDKWVAFYASEKF